MSETTTTIASASEFVEMLNDDDFAVSQGTRYCEAPEEVWFEIIALHPESKENVVDNKTVPLSVLEVLSRDSDSRIRWGVATKRKLSVPLMNALAKDADASVRKRIACNGSATREVLEGLLLDEDEDIASRVKERLENGDFKNAR